MFGQMKPIFGAGIVLAVGYLVVHHWAFAQVLGTTAPHDPRVYIVLAEARRENWKYLMRGHLRSLTESMRHLSNGEFEAAAASVEFNFGLAPGTVEYCREPLFTKEDSVRAATLAPSPPPEVRAMFDEMHTAARTFVIDARTASRSNAYGRVEVSRSTGRYLLRLPCRISYRLKSGVWPPAALARGNFRELGGHRGDWRPQGLGLRTRAGGEAE